MNLPKIVLPCIFALSHVSAPCAPEANFRDHGKTIDECVHFGAWRDFIVNTLAGSNAEKMFPYWQCSFIEFFATISPQIEPVAHDCAKQERKYRYEHFIAHVAFPLATLMIGFLLTSNSRANRP